MTDAEIRELLKAATPGPWRAIKRARADQPPLVMRPPSGAPDDDGDLVARALRQEDARLLAAAPELARLLLEARAEWGEALLTVGDACADLAAIDAILAGDPDPPVEDGEVAERVLALREERDAYRAALEVIWQADDLAEADRCPTVCAGTHGVDVHDDCNSCDACIDALNDVSEYARNALRRGGAR